MPVTTYIVIAVSFILGILLLWRGLTNLFATDLYKTRGFLQTLLSLMFFGIMAFCVAIKLSLTSYTPMPSGKPLARVQFEVQDQEAFTYVATVTRFGGIPRRYEISGDQWSLDVRSIRWSQDMNDLKFRNLFQISGLHSSYSVPRTSKQAPPKDHTFLKHKLFDIKPFYNALKQDLPFLEIKDTSTLKGPFIDGGQYDIYFDENGLLHAELIF